MRNDLIELENEWRSVAQEKCLVTSEAKKCRYPMILGRSCVVCLLEETYKNVSIFTYRMCSLHSVVHIYVICYDNR